MPNQTPSQYEIARSQQRDASQNMRARNRALKTVRNEVEHAIALDSKAARVEGQIARHDADRESFQQLVQQDQSAYHRRVIFLSAIALYVFMEFLASGDVGEMLASMIAPLFSPELTANGTPIWMRRLASAIFVGGALGATLLTKFLTSWYGAKFEQARAAALPGEHLRFWRSTIGVGALHMTKIAYIVAVAGLYLWLYGFAQERAAFMAEIAKEQTQTIEWTDLGVTLEGGNIKTDEATPATNGEKAGALGTTKLAGAAGVFYTIIVALHALLIFFPTERIAQRLELAHFTRGKAESKVAAMRDEEGRTLREVYEQIRTAQDGFQQDFIDAAMPVIPRINKLYGRAVIRIPADRQNPTFAGFDPDSGAAPQMAAVSTRPINGVNGAGAASMPLAPESSADSSNPTPADEAPTTNWDAIFPGARRA